MKTYMIIVNLMQNTNDKANQGVLQPWLGTTLLLLVTCSPGRRMFLCCHQKEAVAGDTPGDRVLV
jgi:hypothetical protein